MKSRTDVRDFIKEENKVRRNKRYTEYVKENTPKKSWILNMLKAFLVGGLICLLGQILINSYQAIGFDEKTAALYTSISLVFLSALFTGLNIYSKLGAFAGAGSLVPVTGFANSVASPAIEFQKEGQVFGIGVKIFSIAGPVILYGILISWILGAIYWIFELLFQ